MAEQKIMTLVKIMKRVRLLPGRWLLYLECGHDAVVIVSGRPARKEIRCELCEKP